MQTGMRKPENTSDIIKHLGDVNYPVTGRQFMEACNNMSDIGDQQKEWVKANIDPNSTYNSAEEIRKVLNV